MSEHPQHDHDPAPPEKLLSAGALRMALDTPWRARLELRRLLSWPMSRLVFALAGVRWGRGWRFYGVPILQKHRRSTLIIGDGLSLRSTPHSNALGPNHPVILSTRSGWGPTASSPTPTSTRSIWRRAWPARWTARLPR